jgi:multidrug resistance efflux pump
LVAVEERLWLCHPSVLKHGLLDKMETLPPIPSPFAARWRRHRLAITHFLVFSALCAAIVLAWQQVQQPAQFVGQVEVLQTVVSSRDDGFITNLWVAPLQEMNTGDLVAEVITTDPRTVNNRLEVMRDRMRLTQLEMEPILNRQRGALSYEQLGVDCARVKAELEIARVNLKQAQTQLARDEKILKEGVLSPELYELSAVRAKAFEVEVAEKTKLVERTEKALERLAFMADSFVPGGENDPLRLALAVEEEKIKVFEGKTLPLRLLAASKGIVTAIHRQAGEQITAGEPIATITSGQSGRIVGFLPRDFPIEPRVGMKVEVRTRSRKRTTGCAAVIGISPHLEPLTNSLVGPLAVRPLVVPAMGRILSISLPAELKLLPGEPVDLSFALRSTKEGNGRGTGAGSALSQP